MNELQEKLAKRRKSIADMESGSRLDDVLNSQKTTSTAAAAANTSSSAAHSEMQAKLDRRRRLNNEGQDSPDLAAVVQPTEPVQPPPEPPAVNTSVTPTSTATSTSSVAVNPINNNSGATSTEIDTTVVPTRRPPAVPQQQQNARVVSGARRFSTGGGIIIGTGTGPGLVRIQSTDSAATNTPPSQSTASGVVPSLVGIGIIPACDDGSSEKASLSDTTGASATTTDAAADGVSQISLTGSPVTSVGSSAAGLLLPWNQSIHSLRERRTPDKKDNSNNAGLHEAHAKQHRRRKSIKQILLADDFDANATLATASNDTLIAVLNELERELGPGAFDIAVRKLHGRRAVSRLRDTVLPTSALASIILDCATAMGLDMYKDVVEQLHITKAREAGYNQGESHTPRGRDSNCSEPGDVNESDPSAFPFLLMSCCHETGKWSICEGAEGIIATITERHSQSHTQGQQPRLKVIGAIGAIRKGKSYFLNRVAGRQSGFSVSGDGASAGTEGIWAWYRAESNTILLDTAGMFDTRRRNKKMDEQLFLCTSVLSSLIVYNTTNSVDENALCDFGNSSRLAKTLFRKQQKPRRGAPFKPEGQLPPLLWLIRDFSLGLGHYEGSCNTYLAKQLLPVKDDYTDNLITVMNEARETIKCMFGEDISCSTMSKPFVSKEMLSRLDSFPFHALPPDFQLSVNLAVDDVIKATPEKIFFKLPLTLDETVAAGSGNDLCGTPRVFFHYAQALCECMNGGLPMDLNSMWDFVHDKMALPLTITLTPEEDTQSS